MLGVGSTEIQNVCTPHTTAHEFGDDYRNNLCIHTYAQMWYVPYNNTYMHDPWVCALSPHMFHMDDWVCCGTYSNHQHHIRMSRDYDPVPHISSTRARIVNDDPNTTHMDDTWYRDRELRKPYIHY